VLTTEEFRTWCRCLQLRPETEALLTKIRESPPVRKVRGRASNVTGRYPSPKMGCSIQFESQHVELWALYTMERDEAVLEYYDQPIRIPLSYRAKSGRKTTQWHPPDLMGIWRCPPGEAEAEKVGLSYRVRSSAEFHPTYIQNLKFLQDFWAHPAPLDPVSTEAVKTLVETTPGLPLTHLLDALPDLSVDVVWAMLSTGQIWTDLEAAFLMHHDRVALYLTAEAKHSEKRASSREPVRLTTPASFVWDGRLFGVEQLADVVTFHPEVGEPFTLKREIVEPLIKLGEISLVKEGSATASSPQIREALLRAGPMAREAANRRLEQIVTYQQGGKTNSPTRSIQRWRQAYQRAQAQFGCGYIGLLDHVIVCRKKIPA
jgi:putative transposase